MSLPVPVRSRRAGFALATSLLAASLFAAGIPTAIYPLYEKTFGFGPAIVGLIFSAYALGAFAAMTLLAPQAPTVGRRPILIGGMALIVLAAMTFAFARGAVPLAAARVVSGFSTGATASLATGTLLDLEPNRDAHRVASVSVAANYGSLALGISLSGVLVAYATAPLVLPYILMGAAGAAALAGAFWAPETRRPERDGPRFRWLRVSVPREVRGAFGIAVVAIVATFALSGFYGSLAGAFLQKEVGISNPAFDGVAVALPFATLAVTGLAMRRRTDRSAVALGFPVVLVSLGLFVVSVPTASLAFFLTGSGVLGVGLGAIFWGSLTLLARVAPEDRADQVLAGFYVAGYLALALPTVGMGFAFEVVGIPISGTLFAVALAGLVVGALAATLRTPTPPDRPSG
jgi:predicted MFS family arabinose efflux permease